MVVTFPIGNNSDNKNNKTPLPNSKVKPIANDIFSGNAFIFSNSISPPLSKLNRFFYCTTIGFV